MPRRSHTYAVRLAIEGGGQVKAELVSVGQSGERSLKRIETAGGRASGSRAPATATTSWPRSGASYIADPARADPSRGAAPWTETAPAAGQGARTPLVLAVWVAIASISGGDRQS